MQSASVIISIVALLVGIYGAVLSSVNSYYQFFYTSSKVNASVLGCEYNQNNELLMKIAFSNIGNKDVIIEAVYIIVSGDVKEDNNNSNVPIYHLRNFDPLERPLPGPSLPKILKSGELLIVEVNVPFDHFRYLSKIRNSSEYKSDRLFVGFEVNLINNKALRIKGRSMRPCVIRDDGNVALIKQRDEIIDLKK